MEKHSITIHTKCRDAINRVSTEGDGDYVCGGNYVWYVIYMDLEIGETPYGSPRYSKINATCRAVKRRWRG